MERAMGLEPSAFACRVVPSGPLGRVTSDHEPEHVVSAARSDGQHCEPGHEGGEEDGDEAQAPCRASGDLICQLDLPCERSGLCSMKLDELDEE